MVDNKKKVHTMTKSELIKMLNQHGSLRAVSRVVGIPHQRLSDIFNGKVKEKPEDVKTIGHIPFVVERPFNIGFFDIETTDLGASMGTMLAYSLWTTKKQDFVTRSICDFSNWKRDFMNLDDSTICQSAYNELKHLDMVVYWFGDRFDWTFINSRLSINGMKTLPPTFPSVDLWKTAKYSMRFRSNRMDAVAQSYRLPERKQETSYDHWAKANRGCEEAIRYLTTYCQQDVNVLRHLYEKMRPLVKQHPNVNMNTNMAQEECPVCGSTHLVDFGHHYTRTQKYKRYQCNDCGAFSRQRGTTLTKYHNRVG